MSNDKIEVGDIVGLGGLYGKVTFVFGMVRGVDRGVEVVFEDGDYAHFEGPDLKLLKKSEEIGNG